MRCLACGAEMRLKEEVGEETLLVSGFKRHTFQCSVCGDIEQRLAFGRAVESSRADAVAAMRGSEIPVDPERPLPSEPPLVSLWCAAEHEEAVPPSVAKGIFSNLARISRAMVRRLSHAVTFRSSVPNLATPPTVPNFSIPPTLAPLSDVPCDPNIPTTSPQLAEPVSILKITPIPPSHVTDTEFNECEDLLRRAIELVSVPKRSSQVSLSLSECPSEIEQPVVTVESGAPAIPSGPPNSGLATPITAAKLGAGSTAPVARPGSPAVMSSVLKPEPETPTKVTQSPRAEGSPPSRIVVHIEYDRAKGKYFATDINTGFPILRHQDGIRLREICKRMNLHVVEEEVTTAGYWSQVPSKAVSARQVRKKGQKQSI